MIKAFERESHVACIKESIFENGKTLITNESSVLARLKMESRSLLLRYFSLFIFKIYIAFDEKYRDTMK